MAELAHILGSMLPKDPNKPREELNRLFRTEISGWNFLPLISGRVALALALKLLGVKKGEKVAIPSLCCGAVLTAIHELEAKPIFIDMEPRTLSVSISSLAKVVKSNRICALVIAHAIGALSDISAISSIAQRSRIPVIDDAAYLVGLKSNDGYYYGTKGDLGIWSFNNKGLQGLGGGILLYPDSTRKRVQKNLTQLIHAPKCDSEIATVKEGMENLIRSILKSKIPHFLAGDTAPSERLPAESVLPYFEGYFLASPIQVELMIDQWSKREVISGILDRNFSLFKSEIAKIPGISIMPLKYGGKYVQYFPIILEGDVSRAEQTIVTSDWKRRYQLRAYLYNRGIQSSTGYTPHFLREGSNEGCPNCQRYWKKIIFLPAHSLISPGQARYIVDVLKSWAITAGGY